MFYTVCLSVSTKQIYLPTVLCFWICLLAGRSVGICELEFWPDDAIMKRRHHMGLGLGMWWSSSVSAARPRSWHLGRLHRHEEHEDFNSSDRADMSQQSVSWTTTKTLDSLTQIWPQAQIRLQATYLIPGPDLTHSPDLIPSLDLTPSPDLTHSPDQIPSSDLTPSPDLTQGLDLVKIRLLPQA